MSVEEPEDERRSSERRWVMMRVSVEDQNRVFLSQTINVSDTGLLIESVPEMQLQPGQQVSVVIQNVLDDAQAETSRIIIVVRVSEDGVALRFAD